MPSSKWPQQPQFNKSGGFFARHPWAALAVLFLLWAFASTLDYEDTRGAECERHNQQYDKGADKCH